MQYTKVKMVKENNVINSKSILVFDLDGTLVFDGISIDSQLLEELKRINSSYKVIFASARPIRDMLPLLSDFANNDLIGGNGSMIRFNQQISTVSVLDEASVDYYKSFIINNHFEFIIDYDWDYTARISGNNDVIKKLDIDKLAKNVAWRSKNVTKIIIFGVEEEQFRTLKLEDGVNALYHKNVKELVITAKEADKYDTLKQLIGEKKYIAFGNDKNDIYLLKNAEISVSVGNDDEIRQISTLQLSDGNELAYFLTTIKKES